MDSAFYVLTITGQDNYIKRRVPHEVSLKKSVDGKVPMTRKSSEYPSSWHIWEQCLRETLTKNYHRLMFQQISMF